MSRRDNKKNVLLTIVVMGNMGNIRTTTDNIIIFIVSRTRQEDTQGVEKAKATVVSLELATRKTELRAGGDRVVDGIVNGGRRHREH